MINPQSPTGPKCGKPLAGHALLGLCPECLLAAGLMTDTGGLEGENAATFVPPSPEELAARFPQLEIIELIGRGGMGAVYKARQKQLGRLVALKILPPGVSHAPSFSERFAREARALAMLHHPNIVTLYEFGESEGQFHFLMEFVDGVNLRQAMRASRFTPQQALAIVPKICDALQYAHEEGVLHRDIKPENILLDAKGRVKLADFGIAKLIGPGADSPVSESVAVAPHHDLTHSGAALGTPSYMAPEQQDTPGDVDHRADIYSLGVVFYELLTGELPAVSFAPPSTISASDPRVDAVVRQALEKERTRRQSSAGEMKTQVETIAGSEASPNAAALVKRSHHFRLAEAPRAPSRFSRLAIVGAVWIVLGVSLALVTKSFADSFSRTTGGPQGLILACMISMAVIYVSSPFGLTILGWVAVGQIRRSAGRLCGLWLAVFGGLLFPLLFVDAWIFRAWNSISRTAVTHFANPNLLAQLALPASALTAAMVDYFIVRSVWRVVNKPPGPSPWFEHRWWPRGIIAGLVMLVLLGLGLWLPFTGIFARREPVGNAPPPAGHTGAPFVARLTEGTVELIALAPNPSAKQPAWNPDGSPAEGPFPSLGGTDTADGFTTREVAFRVRSAGSPSEPVAQKDQAAGAFFMGSTIQAQSKVGQSESFAFVQAMACPPAVLKMNFKVGVAEGLWETVLQFDKPANSHQTASAQERNLEAGVEMTEGQGGDIAVAFHYSVRDDFETRLAYRNSDGTVLPLRGNATHGTGGLINSIVSISAADYAQIEAFVLQKRTYQWVEFRNVSLHRGQITAVEMVDAREAH
jgi:serine/threonine protein kinase